MEDKFLDVVLNDTYWWIIISTLFVSVLVYMIKLVRQRISNTTITGKQIETLMFLGLLSFLIGILAQIKGFISALDAIIRAADISFGMVVAALKTSFYLPYYGLIVLIFSMIGALIFRNLIKE